MRGAAALPVLLTCALTLPAQETSKTKTGLAYDRQGSGPAVVLIPGSNLDRRMWARDVEWLKPSYTVIRYDLRAHGESALPVPSLTPVADLLALLDELGVRRASLVGLSAGSGIALDAALEAPDRVETIVLAAPTVAGYAPKGMPPFFADLRTALMAGDYQRANEVMLASPILAVPEASRALVRTMVMENSRLWTVPRELMPPPGRPAIDRLEQVKAPALVLVGEHDLDAMQEQAGLLGRRVPGARVTIVPGGGHLLNLTSPAVFQKAVTDFLQSATTR